MTLDDAHQHLYKEEMKARMTADATNRSKIMQSLQESIDQLDSPTYSYGNIVQIVIGIIATDPTVSCFDGNSDGEAP